MAIKSYLKSKTEKGTGNNVSDPSVDNTQIIHFNKQKTTFSAITSLANNKDLINTSIADFTHFTHLKPILKKKNIISFESSHNRKLSFADRNKFSNKRELVETLNVKSFRFLNKLNTFRNGTVIKNKCCKKCSIF